MRPAAIRRTIVQREASKAVSKVARKKPAALRKAKNPDDAKSGAVHTPRLMRDVLKRMSFVSLAVFGEDIFSQITQMAQIRKLKRD